MREVAHENPNAQVYVRAIKFSSGAEWHIENSVAVESFEWGDLKVEGVTDLGAAFKLLKGALKVSKMSERALPPVIVLVSDGQPTDDYKTALAELMEEPWAVKAVKIAIGIGRASNNGFKLNIVASKSPVDMSSSAIGTTWLENPIIFALPCFKYF